MLIKKYDEASGKVLKTSKSLLTTAAQGYVRPAVTGSDWFKTSTSVWRIDETELRRVRDWRRLLGETGHSGARTGSFRADHDSVYTSTHSVFPAPLVEWILLRYSGAVGGRILDAFAGGPPRGMVSGLMGYSYLGVEVRQDQIDENITLAQQMGLEGVKYVLNDARYMDFPDTDFDFGLTCPPYYDLEVYSEKPDDISNFNSYNEFNGAMWLCAGAYFEKLKSNAFLCVVVGAFRDKKTGELIDFPGDTIRNFQEAGFIFWQDVILAKNFGSAAQRAGNAWRGHKLVPNHEHLLIFRKPEIKT